MVFIALFVPAVLSLGMERLLFRKEYHDFFSEIIVYAAYILVVNLICMVLVSLLLGQGGVLEEALRSFPFFMKYTSICTVLAVVLPLIKYMVKKCVKVSVGVEKNENS